MYIHGRNQTSLQPSDYRLGLTKLQSNVSAPMTAKKEEDLPFAVNISRQGMSLAADKVAEMAVKVQDLERSETTEKVEQGEASTTPLSNYVLNEFFIAGQRIENARENDPLLKSEYQSLITQESYEKYKADNPDVMEQLSKEYDERIAAGTDKLVLRALSQSEVDALSPMRPHLPSEGEQNPLQSNLSEAARDMERLLESSTGKQVESGVPGYDVNIAKYSDFVGVGSDLLEFMAKNTQHQSIWTGMVSGKYANLAEVDNALRNSGGAEVADALKSSITRKPPSEDLIRSKLSTDIFSDMAKTMPLRIGRNAEEKKQSSIDYAARQAYAKSVVSSEMVKQYQDSCQKRSEAVAAEFYQKSFR